MPTASARPVNTYDVIVLGVGGMGSAACYHVARRGQRVLGIERFDVPHAMGSSHGVSRIIRLAYYEDPSYVPLLRRAFELWRELETGFDEQLLFITGSIDASDRDGAVFRESLRSCQIHDLPYEVLTSAELTSRFPAFRLPAGHHALFQPDGGFLTSERCIVAHVVAAQEAGATIHAREQARSWELTASGVRVETNRGVYEAERLVVAAGAWNGHLSPTLAPLLSPERQVLAWLQPLQPDHFRPARLPVFNLSVEEGRYYGLPVYLVPGFKVGRYHHRDEPIDPDHFHRESDAIDEKILRDFTARYLPSGAGPTMAMRSCIFTNTPDEHFILDLDPAEPRVILVSPCSGHGFKFCPVIGETVADLVERGSTDHDIDLFRLDRFSSAPQVA
ncbi:MAG: N-methyl-L-tryptophan oxidase [Thermomicrobiales bacterium]